MNVSKIQSHRKEPWGQRDRQVRTREDPPQHMRSGCPDPPALLTTPMEVSAVARLMTVGIRLNFPAWGQEAALDLRVGTSSVLGHPNPRWAGPAGLPVRER